MLWQQEELGINFSQRTWGGFTKQGLLQVGHVLLGNFTVP